VWFFFVRIITVKNSPRLDDLQPPLHERKNLSILLLPVNTGDNSAAGGLEAGLGVIVEKIDVEAEDADSDGERRVRYLLLASAVRKGTWISDHPMNPYSAEDMEEKMAIPSRGTYLKKGQKWCVG